jgi:hypothetical protein
MTSLGEENETVVEKIKNTVAGFTTLQYPVRLKNQRVESNISSSSRLMESQYPNNENP